MMLAEEREVLAVSKRAPQILMFCCSKISKIKSTTKADVERFNLKNLNEWEVRGQ